MIDLVQTAIDRLKAEVDAFEGRVETAADFAALVAAKAMPQRFPSSFVLPLGEDGGPSGDMTGMYDQAFTEYVGVLLLEKKQGDAAGAAAVARTVPLRTQVLSALAGWSPASDYEPLAVRRGRLVGMNFGAVFYQLDLYTRWHHRQPTS